MLTEQEPKSIKDITGRSVSVGDIIRIYQEYFTVIEDEAILKAKSFTTDKVLYLINWNEHFEIIGCTIAAATLYQQRIKGLLEALELIKYGYPTNQSVMIADKSLTNYNESLKG